MGPSPHALEVCSINHWTAKEVPQSILNKTNGMKNNLLSKKIGIVFSMYDKNHYTIVISLQLIKINGKK